MRPASSFREARRRRRRQALSRFIRVTVAVGLVVFTAVAGYEVGTAKSRHSVRLLKEELATLNDKQYAMEVRTAEALQRAKVADDRWSDLQRVYREDVPSGRLKDLMGQLEEKIAADVPIDRISFVIDQLGKERDCDDDTETRRFLLRTPVTAGPVENVSMIDGTIVISGEGDSARNDAGLAEAWFDPMKDVEIRFLQIDGNISLASGVLPLTHSIVVGDREHVFVIRPDDQRGYVSVTAQRCAFP